MAEATTNTAQASTGHASRLVYPPIVHVVWGVILLAFFVFGCMIQVQTNEAFFLHSQDPSAWVPSFNVFAQFGLFLSGHMSSRQQVAFLGAWCIQVIMITAKIGLARVQVQVMKKYGGASAASAEVIKSAKRRGAIWDITSGLIIIGNSITDFLYASGMGFIQQVVFTLVIFLTSFYAGTHGIQNIAAGVSDMSKSS